MQYATRAIDGTTQISTHTTTSPPTQFSYPTFQERSDWDAESAKALAACEAKLAAAVEEKITLEARMETLLQELSAVRIENKSLSEALSAYKSSLAATVCTFPHIYI